jgi:hypothetical protein
VRERDQRIHERGSELVELAARHLPVEFDVTGDVDAWALLGAGLVSRMTMRLKSVLELQPDEREADSAIPVRSLYEHTVHLAWLGADPSEARIEEWRKHDLTSRVKADDDARNHGVELFTDRDRAQLKAQIERMRGHELILTNLAVAADRHWAGRLPGMGGRGETSSFRGLYAILYRDYSGVAHPTYRGLNRVVDELGPTRRRIRLERPYEGNGPYGIATVVFALGLYVSATTLNWPRAEDIEMAFERHP